MTSESLSTDVIVEYDRWNEIEFNDIAETATQAVFKYLDLGPSRYSVAILACHDAKISSLNSSFRGKANPTNVLSWPAFELTAGEYPDTAWDDEPIELGDIAIAFETCRREAREQSKQMEDAMLNEQPASPRITNFRWGFIEIDSGEQITDGLGAHAGLEAAFAILVLCLAQLLLVEQLASL